MASLQEQLAKLQAGESKDSSKEEETTFTRVRSIVVKVTGADPESITEETALQDELEVSSLDVIELAVRTEQACGVKVDSSSGFDGFRTVGDIVAFVDAQPS